MDKDRIKGSAKQAEGKVKEVAGKATGDANSRAKARPIRRRGKSATPSAVSKTLFGGNNLRAITHCRDHYYRKQTGLSAFAGLPDFA